MIYNILLGGAAGQGMKLISSILSFALKKHGYYVYTNTIYMSRIRGGHNYFQIRFSDNRLTTHSDKFDMIFALNQETIELHQKKLHGIIIGDDSLSHDLLRSVPSKTISKTLCFKKAEHIVTLGAVAKAFDLDKEIFLNLIEEKLIEKGAELNKEAFLKGFEHGNVHFKKIDMQSDSQILINGNTAIALGSIAAGLSVYSAYPMTPATSIMNYLIKKQQAAKLIVEQAEDEIAAIHIALGASYAGARAMTASSGGGISLMVEALGLAAITEIPLVVVDVMRPGPATGMATKTGQSDLDFILTASQDEFPRMIISVKNQSDAFYQTIRAFDLADKYQITVIILNDQYLADASSTIDPFETHHIINQHLDQSNDTYARYLITDNGVSPRRLPNQTEAIVIADNHEHDERGNITETPQIRVSMHKKRLRKQESLRTELIEPTYTGIDNPDTILVGFGSTEGALIEATEKLISKNEKIGSLAFGDVFPLPVKKLETFKDKRLIVVEMNATGQLAKLIKLTTDLKSEAILKFDGLQISADEIVEAYYGL